MPAAIIDVHTHFCGDPLRFDPTIASVFESVGGRQRDHFDVRDVARSAGPLLDYLDQAGVAHVCLLAEEGPPTQYSVPTELCLGYAAGAPDRLSVIGNVNPRIERNVARRVALLVRAGVKGFKVYGSDHNQDPLDPRLIPMFEACAEDRLVLMFHCGSASRYPMSNPLFGDPRRWEPLFSRYPEVEFVMCHGGKGGHEVECVRILREHANTWIDIADVSTPGLARFIAEGLADRLIFGTDMPQFVDYQPLIARVTRLPVEQAVKDGILHANAARLLRLPS